MTSAASRSLLRDLLSAGDAGDLVALRALLHEDVIIHAPFGLSTTGASAEVESWRRALHAIPDLRHDVRAVLVDERMEAARCVVSGTLRGTYGGITANGASFRTDQALFARTKNGRIVELWELVDTEAVLRQLGSA